MPSGSTTAKTLTLNTDYTLSTDSNGNTTITFINEPPAGSTITAQYSYTSNAIFLDFGAIGSNTSVTQIQGNVSLSIGGFASLQGSFNVQETTLPPGTGDPILSIGVSNVNAVIGTADTNLTLSNASLAMMIQDGNYALESTGGTIALNGIPDLSLSASGLQIQIEHGLDPTKITGASTTINGIDLTTLGSGDKTQVSGSASINVANFVSLSGNFTFSETSTPDANGKGTTTEILVGATNVDASIGTEDSSGNLTQGLQITDASLGLVIYRDSEASHATYALQTSAEQIAVVGLTGFTLSGGVSVAINKTGGAVNQTIPISGGGSETVSFANGTDIESFTGNNLNLGIAGFSLTGDFSFTKTFASSSDTFTAPASSPATSITLQHAVIPSTLVVSYTASGSTTPVTLDSSDYTLSNDATTGNTIVTFNSNAPPAGSTITASYGYETKILIGAANVTSPSLATDTQGDFSLSDGTLGLVFYSDASGNSLGYAMTASATAKAAGGNVAASGTLTLLRNTTTTAENDTVTVGTTTIPVVFTSDQVETNVNGTLTPYQSVTVGNASLSIDNSLIIKESSVSSPTTPVTGASNETLTGVTLILQDPSSDQEFFSISAASASYTTFSGTVTASQINTYNAANPNGPHLDTLPGGNSWQSGDEDLLLTNVSFSLGGVVAFTAASLDLQHYTLTGGGVTDSFNFGNASVEFLNNGSPMVTLSGSPVFHYTTGSSTASDNGFILDSFSNPGFKFLDPSSIALGPLTLTNPSVSLTDFSFSPDFSSLSATLSANINISADATIGSTVKIYDSSDPGDGKGITGSFGVSATFSLSDLANPTVAFNGFTLTANTVQVDIGGTSTSPLLQLTATGVSIDPTAAANENLMSFSSITAALNVGGVSISGSASDFAIEGDGSFLAETGFSVSLSVGANAGSLSWPTWLPLKSATATLEWPNFNTDPTNFTIDLSASISATIGGMNVSGSVTNAVIDSTLLAEGKFALTSLGGFSASVKGKLFGGTVDGTLIAGIVTFDANGQVVSGPNNDIVGDATPTPGVAPFTSVFYAGVEAGFSLGSMNGFNILLGISQLGPLDVFVNATVAIPLGDTGLYITGLNGGIEFNTTFPPITISNPPSAKDALQLNGPAFNTPANLTTAQWQAQLEQQVANQYHNSGGSGGFTFPSSAIIEAGLTLQVGPPNPAVPSPLSIAGEVYFDTNGDFLVTGTATVGGELTYGVKLYADLSPLFEGQESAQILYLMQTPAQPNPQGLPPVYQIYGVVTFAYNQTTGAFSISIAGEADFNVLNGLEAEATGTLTLTFTAHSFNITLSNGAVTIPTIQSTPLGTADGSLTIENDNGTVEIWGGFLLTTDLTALNPEGIYTQAQVNIELNTTDVQKTVTLSNGTLNLAAESFSLFINGEADFQINNQQIFALNGTLSLDINPTNLTIFVDAQLFLGPNSQDSLLTFNANGLIDVQLQEDSSDPNNIIHPGIAAMMTLTLGSNAVPGITFNTNWLMEMNTTDGTVTYTIPTPVATNPPSPPVPTVMGPDYSSSNPLALVSYETVTDGVRTLVVPNGPPATGLPDYSNWTPTTPDTPYFILLGRGNVNVANAFTFTGNLNVDADVTSSGVNFTLDTNAMMQVGINGNTIFSFSVIGGIEISNAGVAAALSVTRSSGGATNTTGALGFGLNATYTLELNTTSAPVTFTSGSSSIMVPTGPNDLYADIHAVGDLTMLGSVVDLKGSFDIKVTGSSLSVAVNSSITFLGASFIADGFAAIYYDSNPGLALDIQLSLPGGAQGIAPISALGDNFIISGAFDLELNTCAVARKDPNTGASIAPGFQVTVSNLGVYLYGFDLSGSIDVSITSAGFGFSADLNLDLFGLANIGISGYLDPDGSFSFTGSAGFQFGDHTFGIGGSISITVASNGFGASVSGWAAAFGLQIDAYGSLLITGNSVDIDVGFSVTIIPAVNWGIFGTSPAVVISETADFHLGSTSPAPSVAPFAPPPPPPPAPPPLAGIVTYNGVNALELYVGQDAGNQGTGATSSTAENYSLKLLSTNSDGSENIQVSALGFQETYNNVQAILVNNTEQGNDTISVGSAIQVPVYMTLGSGNNTITTGSGPANITVSGGGNNQLTSGNNANITVSGGGNNQLTSGNNANITVSGDGDNQVTSGNDATVIISGNGPNQIATGADASVNDTGNGNNTISINSASNSDTDNVTISGTGTNQVNVVGGTPTITVTSTASGNNRLVTSTSTTSTLNIDGGGGNTVSTLGSGAANITVNGNGDNAISTSGTAQIYLVGSGNNAVSTGAGFSYVYDQGTGANGVSGGSGGGIDYYGTNSSGAAYASKGVSSLVTSYGNFTPVVSGYSTYQLSDDNGLESGNTPYLLGLIGVSSIVLNAASTTAENTFTLSGWSGSATLNGAGTNNTVNMTPAANVARVNYVLTDSSIQVSGGVTQTIDLSDIQTANLTGAQTGTNTFDVSGWTGNGSLTGPQGSLNTLLATNDVSLFTLSDTRFQRTGHGEITLSGIQLANLTGGPSANTFTVNGWSGNASLDGLGGSNTFNITLTGYGTGTVSVANTGSTSADTDTLNVTAGSNTFLTSTYVQVGTQVVNYGSSGINVANVYGGTSSLIFNVQSTSSSVRSSTVQTEGNSNVIKVGSTAAVLPGPAGILSTIQGPLSLVGGGQDTAIIDDTGDESDQTGSLSSTQLLGMGMGSQGITYSGLAALNISLGSGSNTFVVSNTAPGTTTTLNSGAGSDTVNVLVTSSLLTVNTQTGTDTVNVKSIGAAAYVNAGGGNDTINISSNAPANSGLLGGIGGLLTINGGTGSTTANVSDSGDSNPTTSTLTGTTFISTAFGAGGSLSYASLAALNIAMGGGGNTFFIDNTAAGTTTTVNSGTGSDTVNVQNTGGTTIVNTGGGSNQNVVNVGSLAPATGGIVDGIQGALKIIGNSADTMNVDDTGSTIAKTGTLTASTLTGLNMGSSGITYSGLANLNISLGSGGTTGNTFYINVAAGTNLPATTSITGGSAGKDTLSANWATDFNGVLNLLDFATSTIAVGNDFNGQMTDKNPGYIQKITIGGSLTATGVLEVISTSDPANPTTPSGLLGDITTMTVGGSIAGLVQLSGNLTTLDVGPANTAATGDVNDVSGQVLVGGQLTTASVSGDVSGTIQETLTINTLYIGGSLTPTGVITAVNAADPAQPTTAIGLLGNIGTMIVGGSIAGLVQTTGNITTLLVGPANTPTTDPNDVSGKVLVGGQLTTASISGDVSGLIQETLTVNTLYIGGSLTQTGTVTAINNVNAALGNINTLTIGQDLAGTVKVSGTIGSLDIANGSMTPTGLITAGNLTSMVIGPNHLSVGQNMAGQIDVSGTLGSLQVAGGTPGSIVAGQVGTVAAYGGYGPVVLQISENGIQRQVQMGTAANPYPQPNPYALATTPTDPNYINIQYFYESGNLANPQLTARVTNNVSTAADQFDLSLVVYNDVAKFNLARLDAVGVSGIGNVAIEGDLLTSVTTQAANFFTMPGGGLDNTPAGIQLPLDHLIGVGVRDFAPNGYIQAASIEGVAFGSYAEEDGRVGIGATAQAEDAEDLLARGTMIVQANGTFRVPFADLWTQQVGFFFDSDENPGPGPSGHFDNNDIAFTVQGVRTPNATATGNIFTPSNVARGAVTALVTITPTVDCHGNPEDSVVQTIDLRGDGASIRTQQYIAGGITSTGPLGDLILESPQGITNVTAPSIFGNILSAGPITGTIQTTGLRTDPITGAVSQVAADLGRVYVTWILHGNDVVPVVTTTLVQANGPGLTGQIICGGNLISQVVADGGITGTITVQPVAWESGAGNLGTLFTYPGPSGTVLNLGGVVSNGPMTGPTVAVPPASDTLNINTPVQGGVITTYGSVLGNITINGPMNGPTLSTSNRSTLNVNATVEGGYITTYGSVIGNITVNGPMNGPEIFNGNNGSSISVLAPVQGGYITTYGSAIGNITVNGPMNGPQIFNGNNGSSISVLAPVQGGYITTYDSTVGAITVRGPIEGPQISNGQQGGPLVIGALVSGGSITTFGSAQGAIFVGGSVNGPQVCNGDDDANDGTVTINVPLQGGMIFTGGTLGNLTVTGSLSGQIVTIGNMTGSVRLGPVQGGVIATSGSIIGNVTINGPLSGELLCAGTINGDVTIEGSLDEGRIASLGSILGNLTIYGSVDSQSAIVSGGSIGSSTTGLYAEDIWGIVAAVGPISVGRIGDTNRALFYQQNDKADEAVIDAIFSQGVSPLSAADLFDRNTLGDLLNLDQIILNLNDLTVSNGKLALS
ncbi:MAG: hypothetical protein ACYC3I_00885 [Gemmataceae bacterium]